MIIFLIYQPIPNHMFPADVSFTPPNSPHTHA